MVDVFTAYLIAQSVSSGFECKYSTEILFLIYLYILQLHHWITHMHYQKGRMDSMLADIFLGEQWVEHL